MRISLNASTIKPAPLLDKIRIAAETGYDGIELWAVEIYEHIGRGGEVSEVERALRDGALTVPCCIAVRGWGETKGREYELVMEECRRRFELAARLGSPLMVCTPPLEPVEMTRLAERYAALLELGRQTGVRAVLEYISFFGSLQSLPEAAAILDACGDTEGSLVIDAFHSWNSLSTLEDLRALPVGRIAHYHIDDAAPNSPATSQRDPDRVMPGDGPIDLAGELRILKEKDYQGWVSLELFNADLWQRDPRAVAKEGLDRVRRLIDLS